MISFETLRGNPVGKIAEKAVYIECIFWQYGTLFWVPN